jgi:hypothetical protein
MVKIRWLTSHTNRGNMSWEKGGIYETDESEYVVSEHTLDAWLEMGACELVDGEDVEEVVEEEPEPVEVEKVPVEEIDEDEVVEEELPGIPLDIKPYLCPEDCDKKYKTTWHFIDHMKEKHGQTWAVEGDYLVRKE